MKRAVFILYICLFFTGYSAAQGSCTIPAVITGDIILADSCSPYTAPGSITIESGGRLEVQAGVTILFPANASIVVKGILTIYGTETDKVVLQNLISGEMWGTISGNQAYIDINYVEFINASQLISVNYGQVFIRNCRFDNITSGDAIAIHYAVKVVLENNILLGVPGSGKIDAIDCDGVQQGLIAGNRIFDFPDDAIDIGTGSDSVVIRENFISGCASFGISVGESSTAHIEGNIVIHCSEGGIQSHTGAHVVADRNTLFGNCYSVECHHRTANSAGSMIVRNSILSGSGCGISNLQTGSVLFITYSLSDTESVSGEGNLFGNPFFIDTLNYNFQLHSYSPAINTGNPDNDGDGLTFETDPDDRDPDGTRLDMGAEYFHHYSDLAYWTILINEFCAINNSFVSDDTGVPSDWIELYNYGPDSVDLTGMNITDDLTFPGKFQVLSGIHIKPGGYVILWADGVPEAGPNHLGFKLSGDGEQIGIYTPVTQNHIDSYTYTGQMADISMGRDVNDSTNWVYFTNPTPGSVNTGPAYEGITPEPLFSVSGGFYSNPFTVALTTGNPADRIFYTTDSYDPSTLSPEYSSEIPVNVTSTLRAFATRDNHLPSRISGHIYFMNENYGLPLLSIITDPNNLWGDSGIYSNPWADGDDWERFIQNQYFKEGILRFSANSGLRIQGGNSLSMPKKSFREFFEAEYGISRLEYPLFPDSPVESFKNIVLRSGYDDDITTSTGTLLRDPLSAELYKKSGSLATASEWATLFLNENYWGIYNLRESINEYFIEDHTGYSEFDLIRYLKNGTEVKFGTSADWDSLVLFINSANFTVDEDYEKVCNMIDMPNFINLLAFVHSSQFRSWTWGSFAYKANHPLAKWKWTIWDTDRAYTTLSWNGFNEYQYTYNEKWANFMPQLFLQNSKFEKDLINRTCDLLNSIFHPLNSVEIFDSLASIIDPEIPNEIQRWNPSMTNWESRKESIRSFLSNRPQIVRNQMKDFFNLSGQYTVTLNIQGIGHIRINTLPIQEFPWDGIYMKGVPIRLEAIPAPGYMFSGWDEVSLPDTSDIEIVPDTDKTITAIFEADTSTNNLFPVIINEIMYNPSAEYNCDDWVELYNPNNLTLDLGGWIFKDQNDNHEFILPDETIIESYGYLILAQSLTKFSNVFPSLSNVTGDFGSGVNGFGLSSQGDLLRLYNEQQILIDFVNYDVNSPWPVSANGLGPSLELSAPDLDNNIGSNWLSSMVNLFTPGTSNSVTGLFDLPFGNPDSEFDIRIYPNPFREAVHIQYELKEPSRILFQVFNILGKKLHDRRYEIDIAGTHHLVWEPLESASSPPSGYYLIRMIIEGKQKSYYISRQVIYHK